MSEAPPLNPGYVAGQIDKALLTAGTHEDPEVRARAAQKLERWLDVMGHMASGNVAYGSRTPLTDTPPWVTLDVATGGFATGALLAGGDLRPHEIALLAQFAAVPAGDERRVLNSWFLGTGFAKLREWLLTGRYHVGVPEEAALLVVAWLADNGSADEAREVVETLAPWFHRLRFYPAPADLTASGGSRLHVQDVGDALKSLAALKPHRGVQAQKEAVLVWAPEYDATVALALETVVDGVPGANIAPDLPQRARELLARYAELRRTHKLCKRPDDPRDHFAQVREFLRCVADGATPSARLVGRQRTILKRYLDKHGPPGSDQCRAQRAQAACAVSAPLRHAFVAPLVARLGRHPASEALSDAAPLFAPLTADESIRFDLPHGSTLPEALTRKVERCVEGTAEELVKRGLVTSGDMLANILPQMISNIRAASAPDESSRRLHAAIYRAFRQRRSLLLLNLQSQVRVEELPWFTALERHCLRGADSSDLARRTLREISAITLASFPFAIVPNKLLQEIRALAKDASLDLPLTEELALDIFMGKFSPKFVEAARAAADLLEGSLYATYYRIDAAAVRELRAADESPSKKWFFKPKQHADALNGLCRRRAGLATGDSGVAANGMVVEQQQILTTQSLAVLFHGLELAALLRPELAAMVRRTFEWICKRQRMRYPDRHSRRIMLKNTAYAWRQMIFFLSVMDPECRADSLEELQRQFDAQPEPFRSRFAPAMRGLISPGEGRIFLGWSVKDHWLMPEEAPR